MTTDQWMTLGIYTASLVFGVVGWLIVREIRANDKRLEKLEAKVERAESESSKARNEVRIFRMFLANKGIVPNTIQFPSPPGIEEGP